MSFLGPSVIQGHGRAGVSLSGPLPCGGTRAPTYHHPSAPSSSSSFSVFSARRGNSVASSSSSSAPLSSSSLLNRGSSSFGVSLGAVSISRRTSSCCAASSSSASSTSASASSDSASAAENENVENVVIVGSGPAGYTAAIYASRASLRPLMFEGVSAGGVPGGQLMTTTEVENFPGFPEGITGPDLMERMRKQAERWGADLLTEDVVSIDLNGGTPPFRITGTDTEVLANAVIVATGATAKRLGLPSEHTFWSRGISACAICDGASPIFKRKPVAVVGGGDTALEEALYLTKYASKVYLLVRSSMRASMTMQERVKAHPDIEILTNVTCDDVLGDPKTGAMNAVRVVPTDGNGDSRTISISGMFYGIGHTPNSAVLNGQVDLDEAGYVSVTDGCRTSMPGVFCAGDLHDTEWRQAITAAGSGCMAAIATERYLAENDLLVEVKSVPTPAQQEAQKVASANKAAAEDTQELVEESKETFDIAQTYHKGQFALRKLYHESPRSIVKVLYTSPTCGPCRALKPILRKAVADIDEMDSNGVHFVEIDIEADPEIAEAAGVTGTPTVHIFKEKARVEVMTGVKGKSEYKKVMAEHIGLEIDTTSKIGVSR